MLVLAHRGARRLAPENTVAAFALALELGADGVELDVRRTADGALVVCHAAEIPGGHLCELPLPVVRELAPAVPRLEEALDVCAGAVVNIEIKNRPGDADWDPTDEVAGQVVELLDRRGGSDDVLVSSFNLATVDQVRVLAPGCPTALLTYGPDLLPALEVVDTHGHSALHPHVAAMTGAAGAEILGRAHARGIRVNVWTVNDDDEVRRLGTAGVDAVITDAPDLALRALGR
jgi:glycerophosphoryl diester phosphodiesterase